jgi:hypothetical protein
VLILFLVGGSREIAALLLDDRRAHMISDSARNVYRDLVRGVFRRAATPDPTSR